MSGEKEHVLRDAIWRAAQEDGIELFDTACEAYAAEIRAEEGERVEFLEKVASQMDGMVIFNPTFIRMPELKQWLLEKRSRASLSEVSPSPVPSGQAGESEG